MQSLGLATQRVLFEFLISLLQYRKLAWDCATGNGHAALFPSEYFEQVIASDASKKQIENSQPRNNICYEVFSAEKTNLEDNSIGLLTVAQALHWFDLDNFYKEVRRVIRKEIKPAALSQHGRMVFIQSVLLLTK